MSNPDHPFIETRGNSAFRRNPSRLDRVLVVLAWLGFLFSITVAFSVAKAESEKDRVRNQEFDEKERQLKKELYGVDKPWEVLVPYGSDIVRYNYRRTYPEVYDKEEAARLKHERELRKKDDLKHAVIDFKAPVVDDVPRLGKIAEAAQLLKIYCDENDIEKAEIQYNELRKLNWSDFEAQIEYANYLQSKKFYSQARAVAKNAMVYCTDDAIGKQIAKQFQFDWVPRDLSLPDDEFELKRRQRPTPTPTRFMGRKKS